MELSAKILKQHDRYAIAYHPDGDGYGTINIFLNHLPNATTRLYSVDNSKRDFDATQYIQLQEDIANGFWVIYLDLAPSNIEQLNEIRSKTKLLYLDHHQMIPEFQAMFQENVHAHNPRLYDPENQELYAAGLQIFNLFGDHSSDFPYLLISLFGDAKFEKWPQFKDALASHQKELASMANALSIVGLTKPLGPYTPQRTDDLFNEVIDLTRKAFDKDGVPGLLKAFTQSKVYTEYLDLDKQIKHYAIQVEKDILAQNRNIEIDDPKHSLVAMLLKDAYNRLDFEGPYIMYQRDPSAGLVHYAVMSRGGTYDCAGTIRKSPFVTGGGHTDRAGCTGKIDEVEQALHYFNHPND